MVGRASLESIGQAFIYLSGVGKKDEPAPAPQPAQDAVKEKPVKLEENKQIQINEFSTIVTEFASVDLEAFTKKYPLISAISTIALGFFSLINILSLFSPTSIIAGIFFGALSISLGKSLWNIEGRFGKIWDSAWFLINSTTKAEVPAPVPPVAPAPPAVQPPVQQTADQK